ncbi:MAG: tetratricopeptide repeat protein [Myxococcales bacterium]|nr:tetratricopeptide repeat protein [Myxococcales bacterium]
MSSLTNLGKLPKVVPPTPQSKGALGAQLLFPSTDVDIDVRPPFELRPSYTGRREVLDTLEETFATTIDKSSLCFSLLVGEAGMGKSRTLREFVTVIEDLDPDVRVLVGNCKSSDKTYAAMAMILSARFGILAADSDATAHQKIEAGIAEVMSASRVIEVAHLLAHLMRRPFEDSQVVTPIANSHQQLEVRTFLALKRFCQADAKAGPLVLCFENLEQADSATINLVHFLVSGLSSSPIVVLGTATSELYEGFPHFGDTDVEMQTLELGPLTEAESTSLFTQLCRSVTKVPATLVAHAAKLGGSPRAIFELVRYLLEASVIVRSKAGWTVDQLQLTKTPLPKRHHDVVEARIRTMPEGARQVLHQAAIIGETFWLDAIVALIRAETFVTTDPDGPTLADIAEAGDVTKSTASQALSHLLSQEWLVELQETSKPGEKEYRFAYPLLWSRVYDDCRADAREVGHLRCAQWLELRPNGLDPGAQEDIGRHLELAGDVRGASRRYRRAAEHARANFFNDKAIALYGHALECLGQADQAARIHLWHDLGSVYELKGDYDAAIGGFERMLRLSWICASRTKAAVAFNKMGRVWRNKGDLKLSLDYLRRGLQLFEQAGDERGVAGSFDDVGQVQYLRGNFEEAYAKVTEGLQRRGKGGDPRSIATSLSTLGNIQQDRGFLDEALNCHREALDLRRQTGDRAGVASSLNNLAVIAYERGSLGEAREGWEQALKEAEDIGALPLQAHVLANLGEIAFTESRHDEARRRLTEGVQIASEIADRRLEIEATRNMARLEHVLGNSSAARELAHRAHTVASGSGLRDYEGRALLTLAEVFGGTLFDETQTVEEPPGGDAIEPKAENYFRQGIDLLQTVGNETELAKGLESYGRYKIEQGQFDQGRKLLTQCLEIYTRLGLRQRDEVQSILASI